MKNGRLKLLKSVKLSTGLCCAVFHQNDILVNCDEDKQVLVVDFSLNVKSSVKLNANSRDITVDDTGRVFVSYPEEREVVEVDMRTKSVKNLFSTSDECYGLLWMKQKFFVTNSFKIATYNENGIKQSEIPANNTWLMHCKLNEETLLYPKDDTVIEISQLTNEKRLFTQPGASLRGIDTDDEGNIYTLGMKSNKLYQLSPNGSLLQDINLREFNMNNPWNVCINDENNIVVTTCNGDVALFEIVCTC